eukprot:m.283840 g.283840  ORF g.283840 m.283840 type:complete len:601 (+) comp19890_c0_seq2:175-1977(+)
MAGRPPTGRMPTAARGTSYGRIGTAAGGRVMTGRMPTGAMRPGTRGGVVGGGAALGAGAVRIQERPMTQAGLAGKSAPKTSYGRTVQDESYFVGALRGKISELSAEITKLRREVAAHERDQGSYQSYEKRAETLAAEIKTSQGELADLNLMSDQLDHHVDVSEVLAEMEDLKAKNDRESTEIDEIFAARSKVDANTKRVEGEIADERAKKDGLVKDLNPEQLQQYTSMQEENTRMSAEIDRMTHELEELNARSAEFETELQQNPIKREAIKLHEQIATMEAKQASIRKEIDADKETSPEEQRQRLLETVRSDNQEIAGINHRINEVTMHISELETEIADLDNGDDGDDKMDERKEKYNELVQREKDMVSYLETFDDNYQEELTRMDASETRIVELMAKISQDAERSGQLPSAEDVVSDQKHLQVKKNELDKAEMTAKSLDVKRTRLQQDHARFDQLEDKINKELAELREKIKTMTEGLELYDDIAGLRESKEAYKKRLLADKKILMMRREITKRSISEKAAKYDKAKSDMAANETHSQLQVLEKKWQQHSKTNHAMQHFIRTKQMESHYKPFVQKVNTLLKEYNTHLKGRRTTVKPSIAT